MSLRIFAFPASDGDCILLSYGSSPTRHVLVDGGRNSTYAKLAPTLERIAAAGERLELLVLSHIDADHIEGLLPLLSDGHSLPAIHEIWFNGYEQLFDVEALGFAQADRFSLSLKNRGLVANERFGGKAVLARDDGILGAVSLEGGLSLTVVSPDLQRLKKLRSEWAMWRCSVGPSPARAATTALTGLEVLGRKPMPPVLDIDRLADGRESADTETPNGSSIAFVAEWEGKRILLAADAHPDLLERNLSRLRSAGETRYRVDLFKVAHHGSIGNTMRGLVRIVDCDRFVISTNGSRHGHPDPEAIAKILKYAGPNLKQLLFNYRTPRTERWNEAELMHDWAFVCHFPGEEDLLTVEL